MFAQVIFYRKVGRNSNLSRHYIHVASHVNTNGNINFCLPSKLALLKGFLLQKDTDSLDTQVPETFPQSFFLFYLHAFSLIFFF